MDFDFSPILENWRYLWGGFGVTLGLSGLTVVASLLLGFAMAIGRIYGPRWLRWPLVFYIDSMRAIPVLVVLVWTFFALPLLLGICIPTFWAAAIALTMHIAPFVAEIVRSGIESVRAGQTGAGLALGMSRAQVVRHLVLPLVALAAAYAFGLSHSQATILLAYAALPTAASAYVLASKMGFDGAYVASLVSLSTLLGMLSLPLALGVLRPLYGV